MIVKQKDCLLQFQIAKTCIKDRIRVIASQLNYMIEVSKNKISPYKLHIEQNVYLLLVMYHSVI